MEVSVRFSVSWLCEIYVSQVQLASTFSFNNYVYTVIKRSILVTFILQKNFLRTFFSVNVAQSCKIRYHNKDYLKNDSLSFSLSYFHSLLYAPWDSLCKNISITHYFLCWFLLFLIFLFINKYPIINISSSASIFFCLVFLKFLF